MTYSISLEPNLSLPEIRLVHCDSTGQPLQPLPSTNLRQVWVAEFLTTKAITDNTRKAYQRELKRFMEWTDLNWQQITPRLIAQYKVDLKASGLKPSSVNRALAALKSFFKWLRQAERISINPTELIESEILQPSVAQDLYPEQMKALEAALMELPSARRVRDTALLAVLSHGLRASEVSALDISDYDGIRLHIHQAKDGSTGTVPLQPSARTTLQNYLDCRETETELSDNSPLFVTLNSSQNRLGYQSIRSAIQRLGQKAGIENLNPHQLRHTFGTQLLVEGLDPAHVQVLMRHRSSSSTERYVKRVREIAAEEAFLKML